MPGWTSGAAQVRSDSCDSQGPVENERERLLFRRSVRFGVNSLQRQLAKLYIVRVTTCCFPVLQPCYDTWLILTLIDKTRVVYRRQPLDGNT